MGTRKDMPNVPEAVVMVRRSKAGKPIQFCEFCAGTKCMAHSCYVSLYCGAKDKAGNPRYAMSKEQSAKFYKHDS